jgi:hypothetical protein
MTLENTLTFLIIAACAFYTFRFIVRTLRGESDCGKCSSCDSPAILTKNNQRDKNINR